MPDLAKIRKRHEPDYIVLPITKAGFHDQKFRESAVCHWAEKYPDKRIVLRVTNA